MYRETELCRERERERERERQRGREGGREGEEAERSEMRPAASRETQRQRHHVGECDNTDTDNASVAAALRRVHEKLGECYARCSGACAALEHAAGEYAAAEAFVGAALARATRARELAEDLTQSASRRQALQDEKEKERELRRVLRMARGALAGARTASGKDNGDGGDSDSDSDSAANDAEDNVEIPPPLRMPACVRRALNVYHAELRRSKELSGEHALAVESMLSSIQRMVDSLSSRASIPDLERLPHTHQGFPSRVKPDGKTVSWARLAAAAHALQTAMAEMVCLS